MYKLRIENELQNSLIENFHVCVDSRVISVDIKSSKAYVFKSYLARCQHSKHGCRHLGI